MADLRGSAAGTDHTDADGKVYTSAADFVASVDNSVWDLTTACGSCHVGGGLTMEDKQGTRLSQRPEPAAGTFNAFDYTVAEYWMNAADYAAAEAAGLTGTALAQYQNGAPAHYVNDLGMNWHMNSDGTPATTKEPGFAPQRAFWNYSYPLDMDGDGEYTTAGVDMPNFMMPNVRELDCLFCHMEGYNNIVSSVAVQMGALNAAPAMGAGLLNMFTQAYIPGVVETMTVAGPMGDMDVAYLPGSTVSRIKGNPPSDNCRLCHNPKTMENFSDMFDKFLAASPMEFNPSSPVAGLTGLAMPGYDLNAAFVQSMSPAVYGQPDGSWVYADGNDAGGPFEGMFPMALFQTYKNVIPLNPAAGEVGGKNQPGSGPIYFAGGDTMDQNALKKATIPFPRADFFKRGDLWDGVEKEVHYNLDCSGCHMDSNATNKDQCDPGRGYARLGGVESGFNGSQDSRNSVKRCENCHVTGKNNAGDPIDTFGAPNADNAHYAAGLKAKITNAIGAEGPFIGDHLDVIDCSVCHMKKQSMAVRALDCTSGNRYPTMIGFQQEYGMMSMFTDPMGMKEIPEDDPIWEQLGGPGATKEMFVHQMEDWSAMPYDLLKGWWQNGPKYLDEAGTVPNPQYRRKIYNINMITAILWDNNGTFDANGDGATGAEADAMMTNGGLGFDPWIQRDLKAGMTFADTGFAVVPIGFGGGAFQSAYDPSNANGFVDTANQQWDYVGVYGGNAMFSTPEQINAYQDFRSAMNPTKPWGDTKLTIFGGPFQVTHNIVSKASGALGAGGNCNDCHDASSGFFSGGYDMTGSAVPTADSVDMTGLYDITQANGGFVMPLSAYNMMQRPVVDYEIVADAADLITGGEAQSKSGTVHEVEFEEHGCWDSVTKSFIAHSAATDSALGGDGSCEEADATYVRTTDMSRSEFLYFDAADIETKVADLETNRTLADYVNVPVATIATSVPASVEVGATINLVADTAGNDADNSYTWSVNDEAGVLTGATVAKTFNSVGSWTITLKVANANGVVDQVYQTIQVVAPAPAADIVSTLNPSGSVNTVTFSNLPEHTMLYVNWGDRSAAQRVYGGAIPEVVDHTFNALALYDRGDHYEYRVTAYVYNGRVRVAVKQEVISIPK